MNRFEIIDLEIELLIAKYGRKDVADSVLRKLAVDTMSLATESKQSKSIAGLSLPKSIAKHYPEKVESLTAIKSLLREKRLFPYLRDVQRYLKKKGHGNVQFRTRGEGTNYLINVLAECEIEELESLIEGAPEAYSDLALISEGILNR